MKHWPENFGAPQRWHGGITRWLSFVQPALCGRQGEDEPAAQATRPRKAKSVPKEIAAGLRTRNSCSAAEKSHSKKRMGWDLNPRTAFAVAGFQGR